MVPMGIHGKQIVGRLDFQKLHRGKHFLRLPFLLRKKNVDDIKKLRS